MLNHRDRAIFRHRILHGQCPYCNGYGNGTASVTAGGGTPGYTHVWNTARQRSPRQAWCLRLIFVTVTDVNGCSATCSTTVTEFHYPSPHRTGSSALTCNGDSNGTASVTAGSGTPGYTMHGVLAKQRPPRQTFCYSYTVTVTDANGCTATCSASVIELSSQLPSPHPARAVPFNVMATLTALRKSCWRRYAGLQLFMEYWRYGGHRDEPVCWLLYCYGD
ncbi:MAG: SprB repeat-containing protein [Saprospiraceae bacterium]